MRTSHAKRSFFPPPKNRPFIIFLEIWSRNRQRNYEDVSSQSAIFAFWLFVVERKNAGENAKLWGRLKPNARFPRKKVQTIYHFLTNWKAKLWGRLKPNVRFWNVTIDCTTVLVCKIVRTSQAKRPFFNFFKQKKSKRDRENCEDVSAQTPVLEKTDPFSYDFFSQIWARKPAAKLWGRLRQIVPFLFFLFFFEEQKSAGENTKLWGRLTPNACFSSRQQKQTIYHFFSEIWARNRQRNYEDVSSQSAIFCFLINFCLWKKKTPERTRNCEDVSSQTPVFHKKSTNYLSFFDKLESENCEDVSSQTSVFET